LRIEGSPGCGAQLSRIRGIVYARVYAGLSKQLFDLFTQLRTARGNACRVQHDSDHRS
jgi:hypothetical protein